MAVEDNHPYESTGNKFHVNKFQPLYQQIAKLDIDNFGPLAKDCPYLSLHISGDKNKKGPLTIALKDTGSSNSIISYRLLKMLDNYRNIKITKTHADICTATFGGKVSLIGEVQLYLTFPTSDKKLFSIRHTCLVADNITENMYIGADIAFGGNKVFETKHTMCFKKNANMNVRMHLPKDDDLIYIPIYNSNLSVVDGDRDKTKDYVHYNLTRQVESRSDQSTSRDNATSLNILNDSDNEEGTMSQVDKAHDTYPKTRMSINEMTYRKEIRDRPDIYIQDPVKIRDLQTEIEDIVEFQDMKDPKAQYKDQFTLTPNEEDVLRRRLSQDNHLAPDEVEAEIRRFKDKGICETTISHLVDNSQHVTSMEMPKRKPDFTPDELIKSIDVSHLSPVHGRLVKELFRRKIKALAVNSLDVEHTPYMEARIELLDPKKITNAKTLSIPWHLKEKADELIDYYMEKGIIELTSKPSPCTSNCMFQPKPNQKDVLRFLLDLRPLNNNVIRQVVSMASQNEFLAFISGKSHVTVLDLSNAFFAIKISEDTRMHTAFYNSKRQRCCLTSLPQGYVSSSFYLDQLMQLLLGHLPEVAWFGDDIIIATSDPSFRKAC